MGIMAFTLRRLLQRARALLRFPFTKKPVYLPTDVIINILSRVPVKSACRFRCVSREWCALIFDPAFIAAHKSQAEPLLIVKARRENSFRVIDMDGSVLRVINVGMYNNEYISTSLDDLVCVTGYSEGDGRYYKSFKVIDPATGEVLIACKKSGLFGFGRAMPSGAYKVFCISYACEVLTIGDGSGWRRKEKPVAATDIIQYCEPAVVVGGMLHLFILSHVDEGSIRIHSFDLETEEWKNTIKGPPDVELSECDNITLGELNGVLCMLHKDFTNTSCHGGCTSIWTLNNFDKSYWVKAYNIPFHSSPYDRMTPLRILRDGGGLLFYLTLKYKKPVLQIYDSHSGRCTDVTKRFPRNYGREIVPCGFNLQHFI